MMLQHGTRNDPQCGFNNEKRNCVNDFTILDSAKGLIMSRLKLTNIKQAKPNILVIQLQITEDTFITQDRQLMTHFPNPFKTICKLIINNNIFNSRNKTDLYYL